MGVKGLWSLLAPAARRVDIASLRNKTIAVDVSIWLTQFIKAMRDSEGNMIRNAHLLGTFRRVCKLLFHRIRPIFVFDGGTPALKRKTVLMRNQRRQSQEATLKRTAQRLLLMQAHRARLEGQRAAGGRGGACGFSSVTVELPSAPAAVPAGKRAGGARAAGGKATAVRWADGGGKGGEEEEEEEDVVRPGRKRGAAGGAATAAAAAAAFISDEEEEGSDAELQAALAASLEVPNAAAAGAQPRGAGIIIDEDEAEEEEEGVGAGGGFILPPDTVKKPAAKARPMSAVFALGQVEEEEEGGGEPLRGPGGRRVAVYTETDLSGGGTGEEGAGGDWLPVVPTRISDVDLSVVASLPPHLQQEYVEAVRRAHRTENRGRLLPVAADPLAFSRTQIEAYVAGASLNHSIDKMNAEAAAKFTLGKRIAGDASREYLLTKDGAEVGDGSGGVRVTAAAEEEEGARDEPYGDEQQWYSDEEEERSSPAGMFTLGSILGQAAVKAGTTQVGPVGAALQGATDIEKAQRAYMDRMRPRGGGGTRGAARGRGSVRGWGRGRGGAVPSRRLTGPGARVSKAVQELINKLGGPGSNNPLAVKHEALLAERLPLSVRMAGGATAGEAPRLLTEEPREVEAPVQATVGRLPVDAMEEEGGGKDEREVERAVEAPRYAAASSTVAEVEEVAAEVQEEEEEDVALQAALRMSMGEAHEQGGDHEGGSGGCFPADPQDADFGGGGFMLAEADKADYASGGGFMTVDAHGEEDREDAAEAPPSARPPPEADEWEDAMEAPPAGPPPHAQEEAEECDVQVMDGAGVAEMERRVAAARAAEEEEEEEEEEEGTEGVTQAGHLESGFQDDFVPASSAGGTDAALQAALSTAGSMAQWAERAMRRAIKTLQPSALKTQPAQPQPAAPQPAPAPAPPSPQVAAEEEEGERREVQAEAEEEVIDIDDEEAAEIVQEEEEMEAVRSELLGEGGFRASSSAAFASASAGAGAGAGRGFSAADEEADSRVLAEMEVEEAVLKGRARVAARDSDGVTDSMLADVQALLTLFGVPFIVAPMEAEAQCAALELDGIVDGVITDDGDAFLFGSAAVYTHIFDEKQFVAAYRMADVTADLGLDREDLIRAALLLGSDYTPGVKGVGPVTAAEVLRAFPGEEGLGEFGTWLSSVTPDPPRPSTKKGLAALDLRTRFQATHPSLRRTTTVGSEFPSKAVLAAYRRPTVTRFPDGTAGHFAWAAPDVPALTAAAAAAFDWSPAKVNEMLGPVLAASAAPAAGQQGTLDHFVRVKYSDNVRDAKIKSKRLLAAVQGLSGRDDVVEVMGLEGVKAEEEEEEEKEKPARSARKRPRPAKAAKAAARESDGESESEASVELASEGEDSDRGFVRPSRGRPQGQAKRGAKRKPGASG